MENLTHFKAKASGMSKLNFIKISSKGVLILLYWEFVVLDIKAELGAGGWDIEFGEILLEKGA